MSASVRALARCPLSTVPSLPDEAEGHNEPSSLRSFGQSVLSVWCAREFQPLWTWGGGRKMPVGLVQTPVLKANRDIVVRRGGAERH